VIHPLYEYATCATIDELMRASWSAVFYTTDEQFNMLNQPHEKPTLHDNHIEARMHLLFAYYATSDHQE